MSIKIENKNENDSRMRQKQTKTNKLVASPANIAMNIANPAAHKIQILQGLVDLQRLCQSKESCIAYFVVPLHHTRQPS